jgi:hypothetical protein
MGKGEKEARLARADEQLARYARENRMNTMIKA